ncbi:hypothetical protein A2450_01855 [candidate division WWE3 bacterium RIFOXYC2_FULL_40_11]|nr:MAG: hypothetical protein A2450_01855 [candidate division WWE3 bacterium RIFOXYC2_FULL_40_11]OGC70683.1 MAG: hypothetical protein A2602_00080 [candidate division WWE3 bacterium RIFOXYD1_FULL_40_11]
MTLMDKKDIRLTLSDVQRLLTILLGKLAGPDGGSWLRALSKFLRKENPWEKPEIFKVIELGTFEDAKALRTALEQAGISIGTWASDILDKVKPAKAKKTVKLVVLSVGELGFPEDATATYTDICKAACAQGLDLCEAEVGPQLRLQYLDQPEGEALVVAMPPLVASDGDLLVSLVKRDGGEYRLNASYIFSGNRWSNSVRFVFVSPE